MRGLLEMGEGVMALTLLGINRDNVAEELPWLCVIMTALAARLQCPRAVRLAQAVLAACEAHRRGALARRSGRGDAPHWLVVNVGGRGRLTAVGAKRKLLSVEGDVKTKINNKACASRPKASRSSLPLCVSNWSDTDVCLHVSAWGR